VTLTDAPTIASSLDLSLTDLIALGLLAKQAHLERRGAGLSLP
jgi:hypothetical protein